jgi:hypothetical protein
MEDIEDMFKNGDVDDESQTRLSLAKRKIMTKSKKKLINNDQDQS